MARRNKIIIVSAALIAAWETMALYTIYTRLFPRSFQFDIRSFFHDNQVSFGPDQISYSVLVSCDQRPMVLSRFSMAPQAWQAFTSELNRLDTFTEEVDSPHPQHLLAPYIHVQPAGSSIYSYDITKRKAHGKVEAKCLIELPL